ncbi:MAG: GtrA family protein [Flavipsychrobacter sp.]|nr:GtrA family protein [Flavipsychrobacter sp.]
MRHIVLGIIDFFHKPFAKYINKTNFRYLACGGSNALLDIIVYYISYHYIVDVRQLAEVDIFGLFHMTPHILALAIAFCTTFPIGFALSKYIVFPESELRGRVQLFRYSLLVAMCIGLNYGFMKLFVEVCHIYATPSKILTTGLVAIFSYVSQRKFTFKMKTITVEPDPIVVNDNH